MTLSDMDWCLNGSSTQATWLQTRWVVGSQLTKFPMFSLTVEVDNESTNRTYIATKVFLQENQLNERKSTVIGFSLKLV